MIASDGYLPNKDNVEAIAKKGIKGIIQPGGSIKDNEITEICDRYNTEMILTEERAFRHF